MIFWKKLNEPFPEEEDLKKNVRSIFFISLFVFLVLFLLKPFGISYTKGSHFWVCVGFGVVTFVVSFIYLTLFGEVLQIKKNVPSWTLGRWILYMLGLLLCIAIGNFILIKLLIPQYAVNLSNLLEMLYGTLIIGSLPVIFAGYSIQMRSDKLNQSAAVDIQSHLKNPLPENEVISLSSANKKQSIELKEDEFLYAESQQNYVAVSYLKDGKINEIVLRNTLKNIHAQLPNKPFFRCHQSYLINTDLIENVSGNAQGLRLRLKGLGEMEIPVSRKYIAELKGIIN